MHCILYDCMYYFLLTSRLKDCLPYCDSNVQEFDDEWVADLPDCILVEHVVHVWYITVHHQVKLLQEGRMY